MPVYYRRLVMLSMEMLSTRVTWATKDMVKIDVTPIEPCGMFSEVPLGLVHVAKKSCFGSQRRSATERAPLSHLVSRLFKRLFFD